MSCTNLFTEDFSGGTGAYTVLSGTPGLWNVASGGTYGDFMQHAGGSVGNGIVQRTISSGSANAFSVKFMVTTTGTSGTGFLFLFDSGVNGPIIIPKDSVSNDSFQRCGINPGSGTVYFTTIPSIGTWYQIDISYQAGSGDSFATLTDLSSMIVIDTIMFPGIIADRNITDIRFTQGAASNEAGVQYSDIVIENCTATGTASFTTSATIVNPTTSITFTDTSAPSGATGWAWDFGDSNTSTSQNPTHSYSTTGIYDVVLTTTWSFGSFASSPTPIDVYQVSFSGPTTGHPGDVLTFTDTSAPGSQLSWLWDFGDSNTSTAQNPTHSYSTPGTYAVTLQVTWAFGSFTTPPIDVVITITPIVASFTQTPITGLAELIVTFTDTSTGNPTSWLWDFGDTFTSIEQDPIHTYSQPGTYIVTLIISKAGTADSQATGTQIIVQQGIDIPMEKLTDAQYAAIAVKNTTSQLPLKYYDNEDNPLRKVSVWPIPKSSQEAIAWLWQPLADPESIDDEVVFPKGYERALRYCLAVEIASEFGIDVPPNVARIAKQSKGLIKRLNSTPQIMRGDEAIASKHASLFNYITGDTIPSNL